MERGGFDEVYVAAETVVTPALVQRYMFDEFREKLGERDRLLFYYSGHGADLSAGTGYMQFSKAVVGKSGDVLNIRAYEEWSRRLKVRHALFIFDCCASGMAFRFKTGGSEDTQALINTMSGNGSRKVITAGTAEEETFGVDDHNHSVFTKAFLDALRYDAKTRGFMTSDDVFARLKHRIADFSLHYRQKINPDQWEMEKEKYKGSFLFIDAEAQNVPLGPDVIAVLKATPREEVTLMGDAPKSVRAIGEVNFLVSLDGKFHLDGEFLKDVHSGKAWTEHLKTGSHIAEVHAEGKVYRENFEVTNGDRKEVKIDKKSPVVVAFRVESDPPGATIFIHGKECGQTPGDFTIPAAEYEIRLTKSGFKDHEAKVSLSLGKNVPLVVQLIPALGSEGNHLESNERSGIADGSPQTEQASFCHFRVKSDPPGATIFIRGTEHEQTPGDFEIPTAGEYEIRLTKSGFKDHVVKVFLSLGENDPLDVRLIPTSESAVEIEERSSIADDPPPAERASSGQFWLVSNPPGATIFIDGKEDGKTPRDFTISTAGEYEIRLIKSGFKNYEARVTLGLGKNDPHVARLTPAGDISWDRSPGEIAKGPIDMMFAWIPPGDFMMGQTEEEKKQLITIIGEDDYKKKYLDELPRHRVTFTKGFWMQTTEVTQDQWEAIMGNKPSSFDNCGGKCPVEGVSWNDAQEFIQKLNAKHGGKYRLPTEAEWEYAARAETTTPFYFGDCLSTDQANYDGAYPLPACAEEEYRQTTIPVGSLNHPNGWGVNDMHGNVIEWCADGKREYTSDTVIDPIGPSSSDVSRALRGGAWSFGAKNCRSAFRESGLPNDRFNYAGFRLAGPPGQF